MKRLSLLFLIPIILAYYSFFLKQEQLFKETTAYLQPIPSAHFLKATTGYMHQLVAEMLYVQSAVFLGGVKPGTDPQSYAPALAHNYTQITKLYPEFQDPYYFAQSFLPYIASEFAQAANSILDSGRQAYPTDLVFPFFQGFNYFRYLEEPLKAAAVFREASLLPEAPPMFAHMAAILSAQGGMLEASIFSLITLVNGTEDKVVKKRYQEELDMFKAAYRVQKAVNLFQVKNLRTPATLDELVPEYLEALPNFGSAFELTWKPPVVGLKRPSPK